VVTGIEREHDPDTGTSPVAASAWLHERLTPLLRDATSSGSPRRC
jgi:hypothetical protein